MKAKAKRSVKVELPEISPELLARLRKKGIATFEQLSDKEQTDVWEWSREVIRSYRNTLETDQRNVRDLAELPFTKDDIKLAIKIALPLYVSKDLQRMIRALKNAYKELGAFQDLDRLTAEKKTLRDNLVGFLLRNGKTSSDGADKNMDLIVSEKKALTEEINSFVADLDSLA